MSNITTCSRSGAHFCYRFQPLLFEISEAAQKRRKSMVLGTSCFDTSLGDEQKKCKLLGTVRM